MKLEILIISISLTVFHGCNQPTNESKKIINVSLDSLNKVETELYKLVPLENKVLNNQTNQVDDDIIYDLYRRSKFEQISKGEIDKNSDLKIGLVVNSYLKLGNEKDAFNQIVHFNDCGFKISLLDSMIRWPSKYPNSLGLYEKWAIYKYFIQQGIDIPFLDKMRLLSIRENFMEVDTVKGYDLIKLDYYYENDKYFGSNGAQTVKYIDSLINLYPEWKELVKYKEQAQELVNLKK